ncbi:MAG: hypothetical protein M0P91_05050 [Sulfuricurvum sp.]|jgi:hypothetical protein|uniref:hypothetical protein n=1 Tax=Sulfuricurvum sp. TaxID=2025608 RepID=UPI0025FC3BF6|nr:hypothetical protein [Sulfuricurvum sp.]MCK9372543.1 hypothetical protein [Sulfuricurvum sp.]
MKKFLLCESFTFLKMLGLLVIVNVIVTILGAESYSKIFFTGSLIAIVFFIIVFILKLVYVTVTQKISEYQCTQDGAFKKALTWLSNIV